MKNVVLQELINRWETDAQEPTDVDGNPEAEIRNAIAKGERQAKRECADTLRTLMTLIGD